MTARELTDVLVLDVLEVCADVPLDKIPNKYVLNSYTSYGAWDQAALWVFKHALPGWCLELFMPVTGTLARATLYDDEDDSNVVSATHALPAYAILLATLEAHLLLDR